MWCFCPCCWLSQVHAVFMRSEVSISANGVGSTMLVFAVVWAALRICCAYAKAQPFHLGSDLKLHLNFPLWEYE